MKLQVGLDLDGVLGDFGYDVNRYLLSIGLPPLYTTDEPDRWTFFDAHMSVAEFKKHCDDGVDAGIIFRGPPRPHAVETVQKIFDAGHDLIVITDRKFGSDPRNSELATIAWWEEHGFPPFKEIAFSADKTVIPTDVFVEDKRENYDMLIDNGTPCALINRPWNMPYDDGRYRIADIADYPQAIENIFVAV